METKHFLATAIVTLIAAPLIAQQVPAPQKPSEVTPAASDGLMHKDYVETIGRMAYVWGWPIVNQFNRRAANTKAPYVGRLNGVLPAAPRGRLAMLNDYIAPEQNFITCPNQDVVYGLGYYSLDEEPVIIQAPDFGDRFWVYALYDARTEQFGEIGKPYGSQPGFYLLVGPNWKGEKPEGVTAIVRSPTELANAVPRIFQDDTPEDKEAIQPLINQVSVYPLKEYDGTMKTVDWSKAPNIEGPKSSCLPLSRMKCDPPILSCAKPGLASPG